MILNAQYIAYIRNQARMGDDVENERFRYAKYWMALRMLADAWRRGWPDCALKVTGFKRDEEGGYRAEIFVDVERSVFGNPGPLLDQFRDTVRFGESDELVINFCQAAQGVTDSGLFYFDDLGAKIAQHGCTKRAGNQHADIHDPDAFQGKFVANGNSPYGVDAGTLVET